VQEEGALVAGFHVLRLVGQHGLVDSERRGRRILAAAGVLLVQAAQVQVRIGVARVPCDRFAEARLRCLVVPLLGFEDAEEVLHGGARGIEPLRARELAPGPGVVGGLEPMLRPHEEIGERGTIRRGGRDEKESQGGQHQDGSILAAFLRSPR